MHSIETLLNKLQSPKKIWVTTHYKPDGDAVGSVMALCLYLKKKGHEVYPVFPNEIPYFLDWIPGLEHALNFEAEPKLVEQKLQQCDLICCLDFNDISRVKYLEPLLAAAQQEKLLIDHHMYATPVFEYSLSDEHKSSTCELVYDFINLDKGNALIDTDIAACLYTGAMTDSGSFRFPSTSASLHRMIADLMDKGLKHSPIHEKVYDSWTEQRMRFVGYVLKDKMEIIKDCQAGLICLSQKDLDDYQLNSSDTEGLVNYPLSIEGILFSTLIIERKDGVKLSFRSKGNVDVNFFARQYFNGGGHFNASGGQSSQSFTETILCFKQKLYEFHAPNKQLKK